MRTPSMRKVDKEEKRGKTTRKREVKMKNIENGRRKKQRRDR